MRPTILLFDAEPMLRRMTALVLERLGATVQSAATVGEAMRYARDELFDVAIVDAGAEAFDAPAVLDGLHAGDCMPRRIVVCTNRPLSPDQARRFSVVLEK